MTTENLFDQNIALYSNQEQLAFYSAFTSLTYTEDALLKLYLPPKANMKVLDIGCGAGRTSQAIAQLGHTVIAIDLSESLLGLAKQFYPQLDFRLMNATQLNFNDNSFDIVLFSFNGIDCIYPENDREKVLKEVYRVLKPGGFWYYGSHSAMGWMNRERKRGKQGMKKLLSFIRNQRIDKIAKGYWNFKEGQEDNWLFARSVQYNITKMRNNHWKLDRVWGNNRYRENEYTPLYENENWMQTKSMAHNHYVFRKIN